MSERIYLPCECGTAEHFLRFEDDWAEGRVTVAFVSTRNCSFWLRLRHALEHIFGSQDLVLADVIVEAETIVATGNRFLPEASRNPE